MPYSHVDQHAHDIAFAVFRVASLVRHPKLKNELEVAAIDLVARLDAVYEGVIEGNPATHKAFRHTDRLRWLIQLTESVGEMKPINSAVLQREIKNLQSAIADLIGKSEIELGTKEFSALGVSKGFIAGTKEEPKKVEKAALEKTEVAQKVIMLMPAKTETKQKEVATKKENAPKISEKKPKIEIKPSPAQKKVPKLTETEMTGSRQGAVLEAIRQLPTGCRMRDLVTMFPGVSERTLRNDLQMLVKQGSVERFGSQGPYSYFRAVTHSQVFAL